MVFEHNAALIPGLNYCPVNAVLPIVAINHDMICAKVANIACIVAPFNLLDYICKINI